MKAEEILQKETTAKKWIFIHHTAGRDGFEEHTTDLTHDVLDVIKKYANQRVIEELEESIKDVIDYKEGDNVVVDRILSRLISLKTKTIDMKEEILEVLWDIINDGKQPDIAYKELCVLFDVSQQSEPFINFAKEVIEYYEQHDIGDEDICNKAKKLINGG